MMHRVCSLVLLVWMVLIPAQNIQAGTEVLLFTPYNSEPFIEDLKNQQGLIFDFARELNAKGQGLYHFTVQVLPRIPTARLLKSIQTSIVPYVSEEWYDDHDMKIFGWTKSIFDDANIIVSPNLAPVNSLDAATVKGKITGGVLANKLDPIVQGLVDARIVKTVPSPSLKNSILMLAKRRLDFIVAGRFLLTYLTMKLQLTQDLHLSTFESFRFKRRILVSPKDDTRLLQWLNEKIDQINSEDAWQKTMKQYTEPK